MSAPDFTLISEAPGIKVTRENASMLMTRYAFASRFCDGMEVIEVACAAGMGLGFLARKAKVVVGADYDEKFVSLAKEHYQDRIHIDQADAQDLPYADESFDTVIMMEALYYLPDPIRFVKEAHRILRHGGNLVIVSANCEYSTFNPSELSTKYYKAEELKQVLETSGFVASVSWGFADKPKSLKSKILGLARRVVVGLHLIPNTMKGKELMKKIAYGKLIELPSEILEGFAEVAVLIHDEPSIERERYKVFYVQAMKA